MAFRLADITCAIHSLSKKDLLDLQELWGQIFFVTEASVVNSSKVNINFELVKDSGATQNSSPERKIWQSHSKARIIHYENELRTYVRIKDSAFSKNKAWDLLLALATQVLNLHQRFLVHAAGVNMENQNLLIVGPSGAGKSTLTFALMCEGWQYLSDDVLVLEALSRSIKVWAVRRGFAYTQHIRNFFPELEKANVIREYQVEDEYKVIVDLETIFPNKQILSMYPNIIIIPEIIDSNSSKLVSITASEVLLLLLKTSGVQLTNRTLADQQLQILKKLVDQCRTYKFLAGRDVYQNSHKVANMLSDL